MNIEDYIKKDLTRRDFLIKGGQATLAIGGGLTLESILNGCATIMLKEESSIIFPPLKGHKVQPPQDGCFIGFHPAGKGVYKDQIGVEPKIMIPELYSLITYHNHIMERVVEEISSVGAFPFLYEPLGQYINPPHTKFDDLVEDKRFRQVMIQYAKKIVKFGKPLFVCTMREMNSSNANLRA